MKESLNLNKKETEAVYKIVKEYEKDSSESDKEYYDDYYDAYRKPIKKKILRAILDKISLCLPEKQRKGNDKGFLREKYHTFNNDINEKSYSVIEKAFSQLKTVEIKYFNMDRAEFRKRNLDIYHKSRKYVIGYCHVRKGIRKFRTSRIASAKITNETYQIPLEFDKNKH